MDSMRILSVYDAVLLSSATMICPQLPFLVCNFLPFGRLQELIGNKPLSESKSLHRSSLEEKATAFRDYLLNFRPLQHLQWLLSIACRGERMDFRPLNASRLGLLVFLKEKKMWHF